MSLASFFQAFLPVQDTDILLGKPGLDGAGSETQGAILHKYVATRVLHAALQVPLQHPLVHQGVHLGILLDEVEVTKLANTKGSQDH